MKNKVLIAVDLSDNSLKAVDYAGEMMACHPSIKITLLNVIREPSPDIIPDAKERQSLVERTRSEVLALMEEAGKRLTTRGIPEQQIRIKILVCNKPVTVSEIILHEQDKERYGTVVVGRRGVSKREEFLFGSVSNTVVREAKDCTVWVVE
jgi:nucleotide-binding universal stress UspA family protein